MNKISVTECETVHCRGQDLHDARLYRKVEASNGYFLFRKRKSQSFPLCGQRMSWFYFYSSLLSLLFVLRWIIRLDLRMDENRLTVLCCVLSSPKLGLLDYGVCRDLVFVQGNAHMKSVEPILK